MTNLVAKGPAERFGRYHVLGIIGDGSLGQLHVAEQSANDGFIEIVALRCLHPQLTDNPGSKEALVAAARSAAALKHVNIASSDELEESEGQQFLAAEYLPGENLASILAACASRAPISPAFVAALARECAEGLRYAHDAPAPHGQPFGLVHGDIRPSNIFVTYQGNLKLFGFGVCGVLSQIPVVRGSSRGGFAYTAPEALEGGAPNQRSDVFSLGVVIWECLTGRQLFHAETLAKTKEAVRTRYVEPPSVLRADVPPGLDEAVLRSLSRDPRRRYQSLAELADAIERVLSLLPRRPTTENIADWLKGLFGGERAALKAQIAQGTAIEGALARLRLLGDPPSGDNKAVAGGSRTGGAAAPTAAAVPTGGPSFGGQREVTGAPRPAAGMPSGTPPPFRNSAAAIPVITSSPVSTPTRTRSLGSSPSPATPGLGSAALAPLSTPAIPALAARGAAAGSTRMMAIGIGGAVIALVAALLIFRPSGDDSSQPTESAAAVGSLQIQSTPAGAQVLIDGDPSGMVTPARVNGLRAGRKVDVQVDKPGYRSTKQTVDVPQGGPRVLSFMLEESAGLIQLEGLPAQATAYVDDAPVNATKPLNLSIGPHRLRVEVAGQLFATMKLDVKAGTRTIRVQQSEGTGQ